MRRSILVAAAASLSLISAAAQAEVNDLGPMAGVLAVTPAALDGARARGVPDVGTSDSSTSLGSITVNGGNAAAIQGAFTGAAGLFTVIQNTGNNVVLQNATVVNINIH
jgi:hypothetical protein